MNPIGFSGRTFSFNKAVIKQRIIEAKMASPEYKAEIRRIFQQANRRIQNIESKGLVSPAVMALNKGDIKGFTKFSMKHDWEESRICKGGGILTTAYIDRHRCARVQQAPYGCL